MKLKISSASEIAQERFRLNTPNPTLTSSVSNGPLSELKFRRAGVEVEAGLQRHALRDRNSNRSLGE